MFLKYLFKSSLSTLMIAVKLNGGRVVSGVLRGFDPYMNIVMDDTVEERSNSQKINIGMVVRLVNYSVVLESDI